MKKLLLLLSLLLATNAWAEIKHLDCYFDNINIRIAFDSSVQNGEALKEIWQYKNGVEKCTSIPCIDVGEFTKTENLYKFVWKNSIGEEHLKLNRKDLTFSHSLFAGGDYFSSSYGSCKIAQRANKKNKL